MREAPTLRPPTLAYHAGPGVDPRRGRRWRVASLLAMLPALVVPFVPFACDAVPAVVALQAPAEWWDDQSVDVSGASVWLSSLPLVLLPLPVVLWKLRRVSHTGPASAGLRVTLLTVGAVAAAAVAGVVVLLAPSASGWGEVALLAAEGGTLLAAGAIFIRLGRTGDDPDARLSVALLGPYAANVVFLLVLFVEEARLGWYLSLAPAAAALAELCAAGVMALGWRRNTS
jgi:hypothetical protein